jgi:elongator complex protein 1
MVVHEKALDWQELFDLAGRTGASQDDITAMGYRVAGVFRMGISLHH